MWNEEWCLETSNKMKEIIDKPTHKFQNFDLNRKDRKVITRLRIGHTNITHKYLMDKTNPPLCRCGNFLSIKHIFNDCQTSIQLKNKFKITNITILKNPKKFKQIIQFIKALDLYDKI